MKEFLGRRVPSILFVCVHDMGSAQVARIDIAGRQPRILAVDDVHASDG